MLCENYEIVRAKIVIAGGFGAGKTTFVKAISEYAPLTTEARLTQLSSSVDSLDGVPGKAETTVALDFGRITFPDLRVFLFGTPGQERFAYMWDELSRGTAGAVVLVDTTRFAGCFGPVGFFQERRIPFLVAVNRFDTAPYSYTLEEVREAAGLDSQTPVIECDARSRHLVKNVLIKLIEHRLALLPQI